MTGNARGQHLPELLFLFAGSGCAALIYEVVWFQMLELVVGSSAVSLAVLLGTFMGGMGLGTLALPKLVPSRFHPLRVYAALEFGVAVFSALVVCALPAAGRLYSEIAGVGRLDYFWRAMVGVTLLLPPTTLIGATLPAVARWTELNRQGASRLGACYGINTVGAVIGSLVTGFLLLRIYDGFVATAVAVGLDMAVALVALLLARKTSGDSAPLCPSEGVVNPTLPHPVFARVLVVIGLSGFCALAAEVLWTRLLSLMLGGTVYNFSIILSAFLTGLGLGGLLGSMIARRATQPHQWLGLCQLLQVFGVVWCTDLLTHTLPFWPGTNVADATLSHQLVTDFFRTSIAVLPATILWGASFTLALSAASGASHDPGRSVASIYFSNTLGAVLGAVLGSLVLLPCLGTPHSEGVLIFFSLTSAILLLRPKTKLQYGLFAAAAAFAVLLMLKPSTVAWQVVAYGRHAAEGDQTARVLYLGEGSQATVAVSENFIGTRYFHVSGKTEASTHFLDMRLQRMLGHLPALVHPHPRSVLVVGLGSGVTAGCFVLHPSIERIVICEIEPLIARHVAGFFAEQNYDVLSDPRVEIVYDDARHFLATTRETFDIITSDPIHPWVKGAAKLYSEEYFALCARHLNPGGVVTQWVPFYSSSRDVVRSEVATFFSVYSGGTIWGNDMGGHGYDSVMLGSVIPLRIDVDAMKARLDRPDFQRIRDSLAEVRFGSVVELLATFAGRDQELKGWWGGAEINRDRSLRLQYLAGLSVNSRAGAAAYEEMVGSRGYPSGLFWGQADDISHILARGHEPGR